jgi:hypothetical protein
MPNTSAGDLVLSFGAGIVATLIGVGSKYFMDYRSDRRRLQLQERAAVSDVMGNSLGQLRQSIIRLHDRLDSLFRDKRPLEMRWLEHKARPEEDGYFLTSIVHRLFAFLSWAAIVQWSIDALPPETVKERPDLQTLYGRLDDAKYCLTNSLILHESELRTDKAETVFFVDVLDDLSDLGLRTYQRNDKTIPNSEFKEEYRRDRYPLRELRSWLALRFVKEWQAAIILARLACLREFLDLIQIGTAVGGARIDRERLRAALAVAEIPSPAPLNLPTEIPGKLEKYVSGREKLLGELRLARLLTRLLIGFWISLGAQDTSVSARSNGC